MYKSEPLSNIIQKVVESLRDKGNILSITATGLNYTFVIDTKLNLSYENDIFEIDTTLNGVKEVTIISVASDGLSFVAYSQTSLQDDTGTFENLMPIYDYEYFDVKAKEYSEFNINEFKFKKFPLIFLHYDYDEERTGEFRTINNFIVYFFGKADGNAKMKTKNVTTFVKLRKIYDYFIDRIKRSKYINSFQIEHTYKEFPHRENNLNEIVDTIQITVRNLSVYYDCYQ